MDDIIVFGDEFVAPLVVELVNLIKNDDIKRRAMGGKELLPLELFKQTRLPLWMESTLSQGLSSGESLEVNALKGLLNSHINELFSKAGHELLATKETTIETMLGPIKIKLDEEYRFAKITFLDWSGKIHKKNSNTYAAISKNNRIIESGAMSYILKIKEDCMNCVINLGPIAETLSYLTKTTINGEELTKKLCEEWLGENQLINIGKLNEVKIAIRFSDRYKDIQDENERRRFVRESLIEQKGTRVELASRWNDIVMVDRPGVLIKLTPAERYDYSEDRLGGVNSITSLLKTIPQILAINE